MAPDSFFKIIPKPKPKAPRWVNVLFFSSVILVIALLAGFFFLKKEISSYSYQKQLIDEKIIGLSGGEKEREMEKEIFKTEEKIKTFLSIFKNRDALSNFFSLFESTTHPKVQFSNLELNTINRRVSLTGQTDSFQSLGGQVLILENHKDIKEITLSNISFDREGNIGFGISFSFSPDIFIQQQNTEQTEEISTSTISNIATTTSATTTEEK